MPTATIARSPLPIMNGSLVSLKKHDQKALYILQVEPKQGEPYKINKKYEDFIHFSQKIHDQFHKSNSELPPKIKHKLKLRVINKQTLDKRVEELDHFLCALFSTSPFITQSLIVRDFFQPQSDIYKQKAHSDSDSNMSCWKRICSHSFLSRHTQPHLSSLYTQATNKLWHRQPEPSSSTLNAKTLPGIEKSQSSLCLTKETIKVKVIYDADNIIIIQVPRSIELYELRSRILQKFSDSVILIQPDWKLLFHENTSSICGAGSFYLCQEKKLMQATVISNEEELIFLMSTKWGQLDKITLRCVM